MELEIIYAVGLVARNGKDVERCVAVGWETRNFSEEGATAPDCETDDVYVCRDGFWRDIKETCMDVAPTSCDAPGCGPKHCDANGPQSAIDCKSGKEYVCEDYWVPIAVISGIPQEEILKRRT